MHRRWTHATIALAALALAATACNSGTNNDNGAPAASTSPPAPVNAVAVDAIDYGYSVSGPVKAGITKLTFTNKGQDFHMLAISRIKPGKSAADILAVLKTQQDEKDDSTVFVEASPDIAGVPQVLTPGATTTTYPNLGAGSYGLICFFPSKTNGEPHFTLGMISQLTVQPELSETTAPQAAGEVSTTDTALTLPDLSSGKGTYKYANHGAQSHALLFVQLHDGKTLADAIKWFDDYFQAKTKLEARPGEVWGGVEEVQHGASTYFEINLPPGHYWAIDTASKGEGDGQEYFRDKNGKLRAEFTVT
ncbi:MAG: hypothetical protein ABR520_09330 [Mycobacteriales bacterium]|nr:hypothetical protein [Frankia sp.]